ncbi:Sodium- and chloride-dependent glycine transporter 1 [Nymphon striatum]|nr:Sodium- and chloride-dependent glycine transporter 1 [Nymphon striatum]
MDELQTLVNKVNEASVQAGLHLNSTKTKVMRILKNKTNSQDHIQVNGEQIDNVDNFEYLGSMFTNNSDDSKEIRRLGIARNAMALSSHYKKEKRNSYFLNKLLRTSFLKPKVNSKVCSKEFDNNMYKCLFSRGQIVIHPFQGPGLAFIAYPDAISRMPISPLWAILFFLMLFTLGLDSQFAIVENLLTAVMDEVPKSRKYKSLVVFIICVLGMILGLPLTTNGGIYVLDLMDNYAAGWPYLFCGMVECILIGHFYGIGNFFEDVKQMIGWSPSMVTKSHLTVLFVTISPTLIGIILILSWAQYTPLKSGDYTFEPWGNGIGFIMSFVPILLIPGIAIYQLIWTHKDLSLKDRFKLLTTPTDVWRKAAKAHGVGSMHTSNGTDVIRTPQFQRPYAAYDNPVAYESPPEYETHM